MYLTHIIIILSLLFVGYFFFFLSPTLPNLSIFSISLQQIHLQRFTNFHTKYYTNQTLANFHTTYKSIKLNLNTQIKPWYRFRWFGALSHHRASRVSEGWDLVGVEARKCVIRLRRVLDWDLNEQFIRIPGTPPTLFAWSSKSINELCGWPMESQDQSKWVSIDIVSSRRWALWTTDGWYSLSKKVRARERESLSSDLNREKHNSKWEKISLLSYSA